MKNTSEPGNYTRHTLQMTARLDFNNSIVQCKRSPVPDGPDNIIVSDGAKLSIQGAYAYTYMVIMMRPSIFRVLNDLYL